MSLLENLPDDKKILLKELSAGSSTRFELIKRKGGFPYEWFDSFEKLKNTMLPVADDWSSRLTRSWISEKQLADYQEVWDAFEMRTFKDWHDLYLEIDVRGLTDVFEAFREMCLCTYSLDPCHYYTAPGLFNDAAYKYTKAEVELLSDIDMHNMFEKGIRGHLLLPLEMYPGQRLHSHQHPWNHPILPHHLPTSRRPVHSQHLRLTPPQVLRRLVQRLCLPAALGHHHERCPQKHRQHLFPWPVPCVPHQPVASQHPHLLKPARLLHG
jgi:hypothetical protein